MMLQQYFFKIILEQVQMRSQLQYELSKLFKKFISIDIFRD